MITVGRAVDRLVVTVLVDNVVDSLSTVPAFVERDVDRLWRCGARRLSGRRICRAAHGLSFLITAYRDDAGHSCLFDAGPEGDVLALNAARLGVDMTDVESIVLSHGHWDHTGGMLRALDLVRDGNGGALVPTLVHPYMFGSRATKRPDGTMRPMADVPSVAALTARGADVVDATVPQAILDDMFWISGEIPRTTSFERGFTGQHRRTSRRRWELDELVIDERFMAVDVAGKGLVVFTACSHAGIVNVLSHARERFPGVPLHSVMGGLHLSGVNEAAIAPTVDALQGFGLTMIAAGHCTGWRAVNALANAFGESVLTPSAVGKRYVF